MTFAPPFYLGGRTNVSLRATSLQFHRLPTEFVIGETGTRNRAMKRKTRKSDLYIYGYDGFVFVIVH